MEVGHAIRLWDTVRRHCYIAGKIKKSVYPLGFYGGIFRRNNRGGVSMDRPGYQIHSTAVRRFGFLLLRDFTMMAFSAAVEPLRTANRAAETELYQFPLFTLDGQPGQASNGLIVSPVRQLTGKEPLDALFVCAGADLHSVCLLYTSPSPRDRTRSRMPSSA